MIHGAGGFRAACRPDDLCRNARHRRIVGYGLEHHRTGRDSRAMAHLDIAEDLGPSPDQHAVANLGMPVSPLLAGAAQSHVLEHGDIVLDDGRSAHDEARRMIEEDAASDPGSRVNIGLEDFRGTALQIEREVLTPLRPEPMGEPVGLNGVEALEIEQGLKGAGHDRISVEHGADIRPEGIADGRVLIHGLVEDLLNDVGRYRGMAQARGNPVNHRRFEARLVQDRAENEAAQSGLAVHNGFGLGPQAIPQRIDLSGYEIRHSRLQAWLCHDNLPAGSGIRISIDKDAHAPFQRSRQVMTASFSPAYSKLSISLDGAIATLAIDNPAKHNALDLGMWKALPGIIAELDRDERVRVLVLRGAGSGSFASGADIAEFETVRADAEGGRLYEAANEAAFWALAHFSKPIIAMIRGFCLGGGFGLALSCDLRIASDNAIFGIPAARLGIGYPPGAMKLVTAAVGAPAAKDLFFTARRIGAQEAERLGVLQRVVPDEELEATISGLAGEIARNAPLTIKAAKAAIDASMGLAHPDVDPAALADLCFDSADAVEGRKAFLEKRSPIFSGR